MSQKAPNAQTDAEVVALRAAWNARPELIKMTADVRAQIDREALDWSVAGISRAFQIVQEWEAANGTLPPSGIHASG